ncbi:MAG: LysE family translocator [Pseudomonadota bacterium]
MTWATLLALAGIHFIAVASPGPSFVVQVRTAVTHGWGTAAFLALGLGLGASLYALAALLGLAIIFAVMPGVLTAFKLVGGAFLIFVGFMMWRHAPDPLPEAEAIKRPSPLRALGLGVLTSLANPKVPIFFGAVFIGLLPETVTLTDIAIISGLVVAVEASWYVLVGLVFASPPARAAYTRAKVWVDRSFGAVLAALGARIAIG